MKKYLYSLLATLFISFVATGQAPVIQWQKCLGGGFAEYGYDIKQTSDSGYIVAGTTKSFTFGGYDAFVIKLSSVGDIEWQKHLGGSQEDVALSVLQTFDGGYMLAGHTSSADSNVSFNHGGKDIWLVKLSSAGNILWEQSYGGSGEDGVMSIRQAADGGFIVAGYTTSSNGDVTLNKGANDIWTFKIDSAGTIQWQKTYGGTANEYPSSIQLLNNGYILAGYTSSSNGDVTTNRGLDDTWVLRLSDTGAVVWQKSLGGSQYEFPEDVLVSTDSSFIVVGGTNSNDGDITGNKGLGDAWVVKLSSSGTLQWQHCFGSSENDATTSIRQTPEGDFILSGWVSANDGDVSGHHGSADYWLAKLSATGALTWQKCLGSLGNDESRAVQLTSDGGYIMTGHTFYVGGDVSGFHGTSDIWVVKLTTPTGVTVLETPTITCVPNPTTDKLHIIGASAADITIYNISGKLLRHATHADKVSVADLPSGIYTVTVATNGVIMYSGKIEKR